MVDLILASIFAIFAILWIAGGDDSSRLTKGAKNLFSWFGSGVEKL